MKLCHRTTALEARPRAIFRRERRACGFDKGRLSKHLSALNNLITCLRLTCTLMTRGSPKALELS